MPAMLDRADAEYLYQYSRSYGTVLPWCILIQWRALTCTSLGNHSQAKRKLRARGKKHPLHGAQPERLQRKQWEFAGTHPGRMQRWEHLLPKWIAPSLLPEGPTGSREVRIHSSYKWSGKGGLCQHWRPRKPRAPMWLNNWTVSPFPVKLDSNKGNSSSQCLLFPVLCTLLLWFKVKFPNLPVSCKEEKGGRSEIDFLREGHKQKITFQPSLYQSPSKNGGIHTVSVCNVTSKFQRNKDVRGL